MEKQVRRFWTIAALLAVLGGFSIYLAMNRIYQVDEAQNIFMARIIGTGQSASYFTTAPLWLVGPLAWLARSAGESSDLFLWNRGIFLGVFWLNIGLITLATGVRIRSSRGLFVLLMAATLAPLWDYGFEIRHDNLILAGLLLMWWLGRTRPRGLASYFFIGLLSVLVQFLAFKAIVYVVPLSAALLLFPPPAHGQSRLRLASAWIAGALVSFLFCRVAYGYSGLWQVYLSGFRGGLGAPGAATRFSPWIALQRPLSQTPLLLAVIAAAFWRFSQELRTEFRSAMRWESHAPECLLVLGALGVLFINPTPFPYNLINFIPFAFLLACRYLDPLVESAKEHPRGAALAFGLLLFAHAVPFVTATWRHLDWTNARQEKIMRTAEALTDPGRDPVYDAAGLVPTRSSIHFHWYLHSLNIKSFLDGKVVGVPQMLEARPAAVLIPNYRTDWLPKSDGQFIQSRYLPLADDFWVLGQILPAGGGRYTVVHSGRYQLVDLREGVAQPLANATVDGRAVPSGNTELQLGVHDVKGATDSRPAIVWIGPRADRIPDLGPGDHRRLFVNWY